MNVAPPTRTRSVVKNRALAAAYAGAHRFGVEVFEPATSNVLMAALAGARPEHRRRARCTIEPWQDEAYAAAHGGLWRIPLRTAQRARAGRPVGARAARR